VGGESMKTVQEIQLVLSKHKEGLMKRYKIKELGVFGSYVRGEQKRGSDIDILVEFDEIPDIYQFIDLEDDLRKLLKKKVDLVRKGAIRPELKDVILNEVVYL